MALNTRLRNRRLLPQVLVFVVLFQLATWAYPAKETDSEQDGFTHLFAGQRTLLTTTPTPTPTPTTTATPTATLTRTPTPKGKGSLYPQDLFADEQLKNGALSLYFLCMLYMFAGLAIICDEYFVPALEVLCETLQIKDDVAGATFMAAGGSAPELATSVLGVFVSESDIGFGTIVGSAVFNVLFVIAGCALVATGVGLTWWPLARDCTYYSFAIMLTVIMIFDQLVQWYESVILLVGYVGYVTVMYFNDDLEVWVKKQLEASRAMAKSPPQWRHNLTIVVESIPFQLFIYLAIILSVITAFIDVDNEAGCCPWPDTVNYVCSAIFLIEMFLKWGAYSFFGYCQDGMNVVDGVLVLLTILEISLQGSKGDKVLRVIKFLRFLRAVRLIRLVRLLAKDKKEATTQWTEGDWEQDYVRAVPVTVKGNSIAWQNIGHERRRSQVQDTELPNGAVKEKAEVVVPVDADKEDKSEMMKSEDSSEDDEDDPPNPFFPPEGWKARIYWACMFPLAVLIFLTVPHCKRPFWQKFFFLTFFLSIVWIAALSYVMVWMATRIGQVCGIPDPVMGVTLLAAGTSVPDLLESLAVAKRGQGDMAVSSSIGSNVFDLLFGLPLPWLLGAAIFGAPISISSNGLVLSVLTLFLMVGVTVGTIVFESWKLTRRLAYIMLVLYALFVTQSLLLEYDQLPFLSEPSN